jgi:NAD(P)-dependent dehydrogenase (short-subunit alcohol dehydrogenase family)
VGSRAAVDHPGGKIAYVTAKGALVAMTRAIAAEVKPAGILVNAVLPDTIDTPANRAAMPGADYRKWTPPGSIASAIAWLASPDNASVTGTLAPV